MRKLVTPSNLALGLLGVLTIALLVYIYRNHNYIEAISRTATEPGDATAMAYGPGTKAQDKTAVGQYPVNAGKARYLTTILGLRSLIRAEMELSGTAKHVELPEFPLTDQLVFREEQFYAYYGSFLDNQRLSQEEEDVFKMLMIQRWNLLADISRSALSLLKAPSEKKERIDALNGAFMQEFEEMIYSFLGDATYEDYRRYQMGEPMRVAVSRIDAFFKPGEQAGRGATSASD